MTDCFRIDGVDAVTTEVCFGMGEGVALDLLYRGEDYGGWAEAVGHLDRIAPF